MLIALTREVPDSITSCELTHLERTPIDLARAREQHMQYEGALASLGCIVRRVVPAHELPDSTFVEDTAVVLREVGVITRPGAASRRPEVDGIETLLRELRPIVRIEAPGTLDGGDVLVIDSHVYVGRSGRTNDHGIEQLRRALSAFGYTVQGVDVQGCLHLKTAVTQVGERAVLLNPAFVDARLFSAYTCITVAEEEPLAANALCIGNTVLFPAHFPLTRRALERAHVNVLEIACDELAKAEAGLTCCSILVDTAS